MAWGGKEAIESIINLKKKINCNDIIFGPKESIAIISKESLAGAKQSKLIAEGLANDITIFNQYGCNSPYNVYIEKNSFIHIDQFIDELEKVLANATEKSSNISTNWSDAYNVLNQRFIYQVQKDKDTRFSKDLKWTILTNRAQQNPKIQFTGDAYIYTRLIIFLI